MKKPKVSRLFSLFRKNCFEQRAVLFDTDTDDAISAASSDDAIVVPDAETAAWYRVQFPNYTKEGSSDGGSDGGSDDDSDQEEGMDVFMQTPLPSSLSAPPPTPPKHLMLKPLRDAPDSLIHQITTHYPLTFHPKPLWHARALSAGKNAAICPHLSNADSCHF